MKFSIVFIVLLSAPVWAGNKVATVKLIKGDASSLKDGKSEKLIKEAWVEEGAVIKTADKSFVKLIFTDKSSMNVGPNSEMKIEQFNGKEAGVIDVVKGQIRSQVTKDYMQIQDSNKSKLFMKTNNAVMGVRGTDFMITTNGVNTSTVLFEGEIVFNSLPENSHIASSRLEEVVNQGVRVMPGEFSVVEGDRPQPTVPSVMNLQQRENLEKNVNMESHHRAPSSAPAEETKSIVPAGLTGETVSNGSDNLKHHVSGGAGERAPASTEAAVTSSDAAGFVNGDTIKPANGSFVHVETGVIIPPPAGSVLDTNTNSYIPAAGNGSVASDGTYNPPHGVEISGDGKILVTIAAANGEEAKTVEVQKAPPVVSANSVTLTTMAQIITSNPELQHSDKPVSQDKFVSQGDHKLASVEPPDQKPQPVPTPGPMPPQFADPTNGQLNIDVIK